MSKMKRLRNAIFVIKHLYPAQNTRKADLHPSEKTSFVQNWKLMLFTDRINNLRI